MFGGRFSHTRFSLRDQTETEIRISVFFTEAINSLVSLGEDIRVEHNFRENIHNETIPTRGFRFSHNFEENISAAVSGAKNYLFAVDFIENIKSGVYLSSNILISHQFIEKINADVILVQNHSFSPYFTENIKSAALLGKNYPFTVNFREAIFGVINGGTIDEDMFVVSASIPPGGELRIDSEYFTVTLNGVNILHQHTGDWINISRETIDIMVATDGKIDGQLLYAERWL